MIYGSIDALELGWHPRSTLVIPNFNSSKSANKYRGSHPKIQKAEIRENRGWLESYIEEKEKITKSTQFQRFHGWIVTQEELPSITLVAN